MGRDVFYITTPIYYANDVPHIGHAYNAVNTDFIARYHRLRGEQVFHLTGTDEHGLNVKRRAEANGMTPKEWTDALEPRWREVWARLDIAYDDYIRTTEPRHYAAVAKILKAVRENGRDDLYLGQYEGWYCVSCEAYYTESDLLEGRLCPVHERPVELFQDENYFFRLSAYTERLLEHYEKHPEAVQPETRRNEVLSLIRSGLQDFSISRTTFDWGIPLPWDETHVTYVWFDALTNYITAAGYADDPERFAQLWPANIHSIGKDIIRFHAVYWPAMLMAAGVEPPTQVWAHGYVTVGGKKMSKTNLTGIHPFALLDHFGVDSYRYYWLRQIAWGSDGNFSWESMVERHNADLANGLGNLASRVLAMLGSYFDGLVPASELEGAEADLPAVTAEAAKRCDEHVLAVELHEAVTAVWTIVDRANVYLVQKEPWKLAKDPSRRPELASVLYASAETLRILAILIQPIMPTAAQRLWDQLGAPGNVEDQRVPGSVVWAQLAPGSQTHKGESLFPRLEVGEPA
jgi:methionyl-tRNA synthetase